MVKKKKNPPATAGDAGVVGLIPGSERSARVGNGNPCQYSCLENPTDRGAWQAIVHGVTKHDLATEQVRTDTGLRWWLGQ